MRSTELSFGTSLTLWGVSFLLEAVTSHSPCPGRDKRSLSSSPTLPTTWAGDVASQLQPTQVEMAQPGSVISTSSAHCGLTSCLLVLHLLAFSLL